MTQPIDSTITFCDNRFETSIVQKSSNWRLEMVLVHTPGPGFLALAIAIFSLKRNPNLKAKESVELSMQEARLLRDLLNRPETTQWLEQE